MVVDRLPFREACLPLVIFSIEELLVTRIWLNHSPSCCFSLMRNIPSFAKLTTVVLPAPQTTIISLFLKSSTLLMRTIISFTSWQFLEYWMKGSWEPGGMISHKLQGLIAHCIKTNYMYLCNQTALKTDFGHSDIAMNFTESSGKTISSLYEYASRLTSNIDWQWVIPTTRNRKHK